jgi:hypothetical protein
MGGDIMGYTRILLPVALGTFSLAGCKGAPRDQGAETAMVDSEARAADSAARAAGTGPQRVANVMIGKRLGPQNRIAEPTFQFAPQDTVYVSMGMQGAPAEGKLATRWLAQTGKTLDSTAQPIVAGDSANLEFHLAQPKGWQPGNYLVTIYLNGDSVDAKTFAVRK